MIHLKKTFAILLYLSGVFVYAQEHKHEGEDGKPHTCSKDGEKECCNMHASEESESGSVRLGAVQLPEGLKVVNQEGEALDLTSFIRNKIVAMNFIFTTCKTICPPMGANFVRLQEEMGAHTGKDVVFLSVSIDPATDTPERLKAWSQKFGGTNDWTLVTGTVQEVTRLLKALKVYTPLFEDHAPLIMMGKEGTNMWVRGNGLASVEQLAGTLRGFLAQCGPETSSDEKGEPQIAASLPIESTPESSSEAQDRAYFTDTRLINQHGEEMRFYTDVLKGKQVVIIPFFTECKGTCPVMNTNMRRFQDHLGDRLGKDVVLVSISVDPENDTPEVLNEYAERFGAKEGWYFLTGDKDQVVKVLSKLGNAVKNRETHKSIMLMGNVPTRLWKKADGVAAAGKLIPILDSVLKNEEVIASSGQ